MAPPSRPAARRRDERPGPRQYRRTWRLPVGKSSLRIRSFLVVVMLLVAVCAGRAFQLQALDSQAFAAKAADQMQSTRELAATRGSITDRNGVVLAATEPAFTLTVDPDMVMSNGADKRYRMSAKKEQEATAAPQAVAEILVKHLGGKVADYLPILTTPDSQYEIVAKKVPAVTWTEIQADMKLGIDGDGKRPWYGLFVESVPIRTYPNGSLVSNVIGFVNAEGKGASGLESMLQDTLEGTPGQEVYDSSTYGRIPLGTSVLTPATDGVDYELTIDSDLQWIVEQALAQGMKQSGSKTGTAIVMDVDSGELLAMANNPTYDPSNTSKTDVDDLGNRAVTDAYEPGSVEKVLTMAALADQGLVTPDTQVTVPARIASGGRYVNDSFSHGTLLLNARGILAKSSNIGTIQLARNLDKATFAEYLSSFGLGSKTGIGLPGETSGSIPEADMADYSRDQISFGQGLSVSAVQMAAAVSAAINGGTYHQPTIIRAATAADGTSVDLGARGSHEVISSDASAMVREMMEAVITKGGKGRTIPGYRTIGKSGTAQRFDASCGCYNGFTASFVGAAPAEDPEILVYVVLDQPTNGNLGSQLALPVVNDILKFALPRYNVLPSTTEPSDAPIEFKE